MTATDFVLGIDMGTSALKAALVAIDGRVEAVATAEYPFDAPQPGWAETDPSVWEAAARAAVRDVLAAAPQARVVAIGIDGQMHGLVLVDERGETVAPAMLWPDDRARGVLEQWRACASATSIAALGNPLAAGMAGPMLSWMIENRPEAVARARSILSPKDWLRSRLVPCDPVTDASDASATLLWSVPVDGWHDELMAEVGIDRALCPEVLPSDALAGRLDAATAASWGLSAGTPVTVGAGDVAATLVAIDSADAALSVILGSGAQAMSWNVPDTFAAGRPRFHTYRAADARSFAMAASLNGGLALQSARTMLGVTWQELYASPFPSLREDDPIFLPYFAGERTPVAIPAGNAGWSGLHAGASRELLAAAAVEGMILGLRRSIEALPADRGVLQLVGGGGSDPGVRQLLADALGRPVLARAIPNVTAVGAARLAMRMLGAVLPLAEGEVVLTEPSSSKDERYARFCALLEERIPACAAD